MGLLGCGADEVSAGDEAGETETGETETGDGCPEPAGDPDYLLEFDLGLCLDVGCEQLSGVNFGLPIDGSILELELACVVEELTSADLEVGASLVLDCEPSPELASARFGLRVRALPVPSGGATLEVEAGQALSLWARRSLDEYESVLPHTRIARAEDDATLIMHSLPGGAEDVPVRSRRLCEYPGVCGGTFYELEVGYGPEGEAIWLLPRHSAELPGGWRAWQGSARGHEDEQCGVYGSRLELAYLVAKLAEP